jgi:hypothetical protein
MPVGRGAGVQNSTHFYTTNSKIPLENSGGFAKAIYVATARMNVNIIAPPDRTPPKAPKKFTVQGLTANAEP